MNIKDQINFTRWAGQNLIIEDVEKLDLIDWDIEWENFLEIKQQILCERLEWFESVNKCFDAIKNITIDLSNKIKRATK